MSKESFRRQVLRKLRDVEFRIAALHAAIADTADDRRRVDLRGEAAVLEAIGAQLRERLERLEGQPEEDFSATRAAWQDDWQALVRDIERRISRTA